MVSIIIGLLLFNAAVAGQLLVILLGVVMIIDGIAAIIFAFRMKYTKIFLQNNLRPPVKKSAGLFIIEEAHFIDITQSI